MNLKAAFHTTWNGNFNMTTNVGLRITANAGLNITMNMGPNSSNVRFLLNVRIAPDVLFPPNSPNVRISRISQMALFWLSCLSETPRYPWIFRVSCFCKITRKFRLSIFTQKPYKGHIKTRKSIWRHVIITGSPLKITWNPMKSYDTPVKSHRILQDHME